MPGTNSGGHGEGGVLDVAIIGAGASGSVLAAQLVGARPTLRLALIDPAGFGRGVAYCTPDPAHLLNVPAGNMSALQQEPAHFLQWLRAQGDDVEPTTFVPRKLYGRYLEQLLTQAHQRAGAGGGMLRQVQAEVMAAVPEDGGWRLELADRAVLRARAVVLALGNPRPEPLPLQRGAEALAGSALAFASPWEPGALEATADGGAVLLVGTGLTAVDAALALEEHGHTGPIVALSRHGLLPQVHRRVAPFPLQVEDTRLRGLLRTVRAAIARAEAAGSDWRAVVDALRPHTPRLWRGLTAAEQRRFLRHLRHVWDVHRHRMAPGVGARIAAMVSRGQLRLEPGRLVSFEADGARARVGFAPRHRGPLRQVAVSRVINCTGPARLVRAKSPLVDSLLAQASIRPDPLGFGLDVDAHGRVLGPGGAPTPGLYTLGPPRRGESWESTAMPEIRAQAFELAQTLAAALGEQQPRAGV